ncbi:MAG: GNAT family N-acetyltransferase [Dissulfurispiraceae bacterium]|jgi:ribosomal protein S18 acetylase RimI-like enzyme|nr:GNAT family N-acetyltransferase [Dissulfurispiraceae bacterium]
MKIDIKYDCDGVDWTRVSEILSSVGMSSHPPEKHKKAFEASYCVVFLYHKDKLVGFGRAISDGSHQAAVYECAVVAEYQGHGLGRTIIQEILSRLPECNVILYASPGKEGFYEKLGFRKMKTGMARFISQDQMAQKGFTE